MKYKKIIGILFIVEIIYICFSFFYPIPNQVQNLKKSLFFSPTPTPDDSQRTRAYHVYPLEIFANKSKTLPPSAILKNDYEGIIIEIQYDQKNITQYPLILRIRGKQNLENTFLFTKNDLQKLQVFHQKGTSKQSLYLDELKAGDFITFHEELDLKKDWPNARILLAIIKNEK